MTFKKDAIDAFEAANDEAQARGDTCSEHMAEGLIALTKLVAKLQREVEDLKRHIK